MLSRKEAYLLDEDSLPCQYREEMDPCLPR